MPEKSLSSEERLDRLIRIAFDTGQSLDALEADSRDFSAQDFAKWAGNVSALPKYKKSSETP